MSILYLPNYIYSTALAKMLVKYSDADDKCSVFTEQHLKEATDYSTSHIDRDENTLLLTALLLYPQIGKSLCN